MSTSTSQLSVGNFVSVERHDKPHHPLKGIVAYIGAVSFAEGNDWVGVRLTGDSIGEGRNDGSVKGKRYFEASGPNSGVFVRRGAISKRQPTRLEELRLRRERKTSIASSTSAAPGSSSSIATSGKTADSSSVSPVKVSMPLTKGPKPPPTDLAGSERVKKRMEELRKSRKSLPSSLPSTKTNNPPVTTEQRRSSLSVPTTVTPLQNNATSNEIETLRQQNDALTEQNEEIESQKESLQQELHNLRLQLANQKSPNILLDTETSFDNTTDDPAVEENTDIRKKPDEPSQNDNEIISSLNEEIDQLKAQLQSTNTQLTQTLNSLNSLQTQTQSQQSQIGTLQTQLQQTKTQLSTAEHELTTISSQNSSHQSTAQNQLKERAKLQAENSSLKRLLSEMEKEKIDVETMMEELTLDLEQVREEKETLEDALQEKNLDMESTLMDLEDYKIQLEELGLQLDQSRQQQQQQQQSSGDSVDAPTAAPSTSASSTGIAHSADSEDVVQALSVQNSRLREALIRLREQSTLEKVELSKQLRTAEKDASQTANLRSSVQKLEEELTTKEKDIRELKEMVDEGHAYEGLMEEMSDKNIELEDANVALKATIQSLEESSEIAAEMEEVQAEENKALMSDLEERDSKLRNLHEAIKMQRRREEDFQRTVLKYKTSVEKLQTEKSALLALHQGGENENSKLIAASQKALAQAAQMVSDAAQIRKKESVTMFDKMEKLMNAHFAERLQSFIPKNVIHTEVLAVKGEILLSKVAEKASLGLQEVGSLFQKFMSKARSELGTDMIKIVGTETKDKENESIQISESALQEIPTLLHELKFAHISVHVGAEALRLLCLGQWPGLLPKELSAQLGAAVLPAFLDVDNSMTYQLRMMKEEGALSPHRTNLATLEEFSKNLRTSVSILDPQAQNWNPPAWELFQNVTLAKYSSLCAAAIVSCIISPTAEASDTFVSDFDSDSSIANLLNKLENIAIECAKMCQRLTNLSLREEDENLIREVEDATHEWKESTHKLVDVFQSTFNSKEVSIEKVSNCESQAERALQCAVKVSAILRTHKMIGEEKSEDGKFVFHPLSPEADNSWKGVIQLAIKDRKLNNTQVGDDDEIMESINFYSRGQAIEQKLQVALENDTKLTTALLQISSLEKSLASRSKEINMQNARMVELEKLLSHSPYHNPGQIPQQDDNKKIAALEGLASSEEYLALKKENTMLMEAMDVLNKQVQEYEDEVRVLKNVNKTRTPQKGGLRSSLSTSFGAFDPLEMGLQANDSYLVSSTSAQAKLISLEAALFRPALHSARVELSTWKAKAIQSSLRKLSPLKVPKPLDLVENTEVQPQDGDTLTVLNINPISSQQSFSKMISQQLAEISTVNTSIRQHKASSKVINLDSNLINPSANIRTKLRKERLKSTELIGRFNKASLEVNDLLTKVSSRNNCIRPSSTDSAKQSASKTLLGRIIVDPKHGQENCVIPTTISRYELSRLHATMVG